MGTAIADKKTEKISIRRLVEQVFAGGSLAEMSPDFFSAAEGTKIHQKYQRRDIPGYEAEVAFARDFTAQFVCLQISGKADGMYTAADGSLHIEEIKTMKSAALLDADDGIPVHWAQLKMYGWFYCLDSGAESLVLDLIYYSRSTEQEKIFSKVCTLKELEKECSSWVKQLLSWLDRIEERRLVLAEHIHGMDFPFDEYRTGQREFAKHAYRGIRDGKAVFLQAATGIGKTMAAVFSAAKAFAEGLCSKVFFLTAKNAGGIAAETALSIINSGDIPVSWINITAKAKICFMLNAEDGRVLPPCDPETCPYALDYYDKIPAAMEELFGEQAFSRQKVEELAEKHKVCPFEYSLELALFCDFVIADYNYAFDYGASLKRFFRQGKKPYALLIDEAHNLVDRARDMFSCTVNKADVMAKRRQADEEEKKIISGFNAWLLKLRKSYDPWTEQAFPDFPEKLDEQVDRVLKKFETLFRRGKKLSKAAFDFFWEVYGTRLVLDQYDDSYRTIIKTNKSNIVISLLCIDPSRQIQAVLKNQKAAVFFSATLRPFDYFVSLLAPELDSEKADIRSGFPKENVLHIVNARVSTRWKARRENLGAYCDIASLFHSGVKGNKLIFSPSFSFQDKLVQELFGDEDGDIALPQNVIVQNRKMIQQEKQEFLDALSGPGGSISAFCVMGGSFSESIDLLGEKLIGVVIFGLGLPQVNMYTRTVKDYFDTRLSDGYNYAYVFPGINKVLQAAGRVIRSDADKGFVYLIDDRYRSSQYRRLLSGSWDIHYEKSQKESLAKINRLLGKNSS